MKQIVSKFTFKIYFALGVLLVIFNFNLNAQEKKVKETGEKPMSELVFEAKTIVCPSFMGFGVEWDPGVWRLADPKTTLSDADWELIIKRITWMKVPIVRMMMQTKWCYLDGGKFNFETPQMKLLYRHLDVCKKLGIKVILTDWGCEPKWLNVPGIENVGDPKYAKAIGTYMDHLVNKKGYSCIRYFVMVNEPNYEVKDFGRWKKGAEQVCAALAEHGLDKKISFMGSDESNDDNWHRQAVDQLQSKIGAYDFHRYAGENEVLSGQLYELIRTKWNYALAKDPQIKTKPMFIGEAGFSGGNAGSNPSHLDFNYGVKMADYAVQAVGAGSASVCAWMLEDSSHKDFTWGMWKNKEGGFVPKPWFYPWALLCRFFPAGSTIYSAAQIEPNSYPNAILKPCFSGISPTPTLRVLAAKSQHNKKVDWTYCLVNNGDKPTTITLKAHDSGAIKFNRYLNSKDSAPTGAGGLPISVGVVEGDLSVGVSVTCPAHAVMLLSTME